MPITILFIGIISKLINIGLQKDIIIQDFVMTSKKKNLLYGAAMNLCW